MLKKILIDWPKLNPSPNRVDLSFDEKAKIAINKKRRQYNLSAINNIFFRLRLKTKNNINVSLYLFLMDELQMSFLRDRIVVWAISSHTDEIFTPIERLEKICSEIFSSKRFIRKKINIEIPAQNNFPLVSASMRLLYNQFSYSYAHPRIFSVEGIEIDSRLLIDNLQSQNKIHGVLIGDSFDFFKICIRFACSLVSRQRFIPFYKEDHAYFIANLEASEDNLIFRDLCEKAPFSIKEKMSDKVESTVKNALNHFLNLIIVDSVKEELSKVKSETKCDLWLKGLLGEKTKVDQSIKKGADEWLISRKINHGLDFSMLFKLEEPYEEIEDWKLTFHMQSKKDPSLIIGLDELWKNTNKIPIKNLKLQLLMDLGVAAKYSKIVEKSLHAPQPSKIKITGDEALKFIAIDSFYLKDLGFAVQIPKILSSRKERLKVKVVFRDSGKFKISGAGSLGKELFDFDYSVALGDLELSHKEFLALSKSKQELVQIKGKWVELNQNDANKILDYFEKKKQISLYDTFLMSTLGQETFEIDSVTVPKQFDSRVKGMFDFSAIEEMIVPKDFSGSLRDYQKKGFSWMVFLKNIGFGGILADDMGLGKTIQSIAYFLHCRGKEPSLVICPKSVMGNWKRELNQFSPSLRAHIHHGSERLKKLEIEKNFSDKDLIISSYATLRIDQKFFENIQWHTVILDEAQLIKNPVAMQTIAINKLKCNHRFCLTGTPVENRLSELWSIMNFANPGLLSAWGSFKRSFAEPIEVGNDEEKSEVLRRIISPFIMRRLKTDKKIISDLPKKTEIKEYCSLTEEQASIYQAIVDDSLEKIKSKDENRRALIMAALIKLKQVCNHPSNYLKDTNRLDMRSGKVVRLREIVESIMENNEKSLVFTQYKEMGDLLKKDLEDYFDMPVCFLHGEQSSKIREQMIDLFQSDDRNSPKIFILSLKAGGLGINLTKASNVVHFDRWWNPAVENQATDRAFRIGQKKNVFVYKLITTGTIEEKIDEIIEKKLNLSNLVLSKGELAITELNNDQLKELFSLRRDNLEV